VAWENIGADSDFQYAVMNNSGVLQTSSLFNSGGETDVNYDPHIIALADGGFVVARLST